MKQRFASHYLFIEGHGYVARHVVELEDGIPVSVYPLTGELEHTEWRPGLLALLSVAPGKSDVFSPATLVDALPCEIEGCLHHFQLYWLTPFDLIALRPVGGTRHKRLP